ncbi:hypothetical protein BpHYR1_030388 [Brachionus plicatilis]|uniref:Uncharacterized protein n=1 Tax=Brachionus plicatilis TaxID=10195 RepID=A0A3M7QNH7_BRAPC|nr:hypothetical protein BpHYR1_030388 [Brachionus plicatilis]
MTTMIIFLFKLIIFDFMNRIVSFKIYNYSLLIFYILEIVKLSNCFLTSFLNLNLETNHSN